MERVGVFVDAGYLFKQGGELVTGQKLTRGQLALDIDGAVRVLREFAEATSGLPLLRIYWYDGTNTGPSSEHVALAFHDDVKVRLGIVNSAGQQKGVDSLVITDMIALARNRAIADAVLLTGDEDLRVGVQQAQEFGVRVHLVGVAPARASQSDLLMQEADGCHEWGPDVVRLFLRRAGEPGRRVNPEEFDSDEEVLYAIAAALCAAQEAHALDAIRRAYHTGERTAVPRDLDRLLLQEAELVLQRRLEHEDKLCLRQSFRDEVLRRTGH